MTLGDYIKKYRSDHKMSMDAFASVSGISKAYISLLEKNRHPKTGKPITPSLQVIKQAADAMHVDFDYLFDTIDGDVSLTISSGNASQAKGLPVRIPVLGRVAAGIPFDAEEYIIDWEVIPATLAEGGDYFGLEIKGDSMEPKISDGDVVIVRKQSDADSGDLVIALINGDDATCKRLMKYKDGIALISSNPKYPPFQYSKEEVEQLPVEIIGKVIELRAKFR